MKSGYLRAERLYKIENFNNDYNNFLRKHYIEKSLEEFNTPYVLEDIFIGYRVIYKIKYDENYIMSEYTKLTIEEVKKLVMLL